jgi:hypothetical protein
MSLFSVQNICKYVCSFTFIGDTLSLYTGVTNNCDTHVKKVSANIMAKEFDQYATAAIVGLISSVISLKIEELTKEVPWSSLILRSMECSKLQVDWLQQLSEEEMKVLVQKVVETVNPMVCVVADKMLLDVIIRACAKK